MFKAIIIEDEPHAAGLLEDMLRDIAPSISILDKCANLPAGVRSIRRHDPDIVFLDIELPIYSGLQLLDFFNPGELSFRIIFTTASNEYAIKAFEMSAVDYLMKPLQEEKLRAAIEKAFTTKSISDKEKLPILRQHLQQEEMRKIVVPVSDGFEILDLNDICYIKAEGSYSRLFFSTRESLLVSKNLKHFEFVLSAIPGFLRIHRSFIANLHFARKIVRNDGGHLLMNDDTQLAISDEKLDQILRFFR